MYLCKPAPKVRPGSSERPVNPPVPRAESGATDGVVCCLSVHVCQQATLHTNRSIIRGHVIITSGCGTTRGGGGSFLVACPRRYVWFPQLVSQSSGLLLCPAPFSHRLLSSYFTHTAAAIQHLASWISHVCYLHLRRGKGLCSVVRWSRPPDGKLALASGAISYSTATTAPTLENRARQNGQFAKVERQVC